ncbi:hypothetical protein [Sorangium sp. So ce1000]|uniref:hypothetical protein n=1 Tax=Sorangium sp. So ce1000 TaxID=3133325 RepID=UPI003F62DB9B
MIGAPGGRGATLGALAHRSAHRRASAAGRRRAVDAAPSRRSLLAARSRSYASATTRAAALPNARRSSPAQPLLHTDVPRENAGRRSHHVHNRYDLVGNVRELNNEVPFDESLGGAVMVARTQQRFAYDDLNQLGGSTRKPEARIPGQHLDKSLNGIKDALRTASGAEKRSLQTAKKIPEQSECLLEKTKSK